MARPLVNLPWILIGVCFLLRHMLDMNLYNMFRKQSQFVYIAICFMGLPLAFEFMVVLQFMPQRASSKGDQGKTLIYVTSCGDSSSNDKTISTGEQVARVLQIHFDCGSDDIRLIVGIPMEPQSAGLPPSLTHFLVGLPHGACQLQGEGPLEERCQLRISFLIQRLICLGRKRSIQIWVPGGVVRG